MTSKKKNDKSKASKPQKISKTPRKIHKEHHPFILSLALLVGFSGYGIMSFVSTTDNYIDYLQTNVYQSKVSSPEIRTNEALEIVNPLENPFVDLTDDNEHFEALLALYNDGIIAGYPDGTIRPDEEVNRAEFAKILVQASALDYTAVPPEALANCFSDVKDLPEHWFAPAVCAAKDSGWLGGYPDGSFGPAQNINRAEALKIILTAFNYLIPDNLEVEKSPFADVDIAGDWYLGVAVSARDNGFVDGDEFDAAKNITRAELAGMIDHALKN